MRILASRATGDAAGYQPIAHITKQADAHGDPENRHTEADGKGHDGDGETPYKQLAKEGLTPARRDATGGDARAQSRPETRDGGAVGAEGIALRSSECGFFAENEAVIKKEQAESHDEPADTAGEKAEACAEEYAAEVKRIAHPAKGAVGDELFGVQSVVVNDGAAKISRGPGANQSAEKREEGGKCENNVQRTRGGGRADIDGAAPKQLRDGDPGVLFVETVGSEPEPENAANEPETVTEFEFGSAHHEGSGPSTMLRASEWRVTSGELKAKERQGGRKTRKRKPESFAKYAEKIEAENKKRRKVHTG